MASDPPRPTSQALPRPPELSGPGADGWARLAAQPRTGLVVCDIDGTLAPIVATPDMVALHPGTAGVFAALRGCGLRVAVVTGRPAQAAVDLLGPAADEVEVLGHYGLERWYAGTLEVPEPHPGLDAARFALTALVARTPGARLEDKGRSVAVHTRGAPDADALLVALLPAVRAIAASEGLEVAPGRLVLEVRPTGTDKGTAVRALLARHGPGAVLFAGDDVGDIPAVQAVREARSAGRTAGVVVCADSAETPPALRELADVLVDGPAGVVDLLRRLADQASSGS